MCNSTSHKKDQALRAPRYMLLSGGLELSDHNTIQAWEDIVNYPGPLVTHWESFLMGHVEPGGASGQRKGKTL